MVKNSSFITGKVKSKTKEITQTGIPQTYLNSQIPAMKPPIIAKNSTIQIILCKDGII